MTGFLKKFFVPSLLASMLFVFAAPASSQEPAASQADPGAQPPAQGEEYYKEVVVRVNGVEITRGTLLIAINRILPVQTFHAAVGEERYERAQKQALDELINREIIYMDAVKNKAVTVKDSEIDDKIEELTKGIKEKGMTLDEALEKSKMTMEDLRDDVAQTLTTEKTREKKIEEFEKQAAGTVTADYMKDYYDKNLDKFKEPEQVRLRTILIKADRSGGSAAWSEAREKAVEIAEAAMRGEDFAELAKKFSEDPYAKDGGDMGWAHEGSLTEEIDYVAAGLEVGAVSNPIESIYGYHVIKVEERKLPVIKGFSELNHERLEAELEDKESTRLWRDWIEGLRKEAKIEYLAKDLY